MSLASFASTLKVCATITKYLRLGNMHRTEIYGLEVLGVAGMCYQVQAPAKFVGRDMDSHVWVFVQGSFSLPTSPCSVLEAQARQASEGGTGVS